MPDGLNRSSTATIIRSPALNTPSSQSALPRRPESSLKRARMRSWTRGRGGGGGPGLVALHELDGYEIKDRRLNRAKRGKHPCDRARPGIRIVRQQTRMALRDMKHDRPRLEQAKIAFFISRNLPERM